MSTSCLPNVFGIAEIFGLVVATCGVLSTTFALRSLVAKTKIQKSDADEYVAAFIKAERLTCCIMFWNFGLAYCFSLPDWTVALTYGIGFSLLSVVYFLLFAATIESCVALRSKSWRWITGRGNAKAIVFLTYTFFGTVYVLFPMLGWSCADSDMCSCVESTPFLTLSCAEPQCSQLFPPLRYSYVLSPIFLYSLSGLVVLHKFCLIQKSQKSDSNTDSLKSMWLYTLLSSLPISLLIMYDTLLWFNANPTSFWSQEIVVEGNEFRVGLEDGGNFVTWGKFFVAVSMSTVIVSSYYIINRYTPFKETTD